MTRVRWFVAAVGWRLSILVATTLVTSLLLVAGQLGRRQAVITAAAVVVAAIVYGVLVLLFAQYALQLQQRYKRVSVGDMVVALPVGVAFAAFGVIFAFDSGGTGSVIGWIAVGFVILFCLNAAVWLIGSAAAPLVNRFGLAEAWTPRGDPAREMHEFVMAIAHRLRIKRWLLARFWPDGGARVPLNGQRVNPLFLPGTALRFATLAIVAVATTWDAWQVMIGTALGVPYRQAMDRCVEGVATALQLLDHDPGDNYAITAGQTASIVDSANHACASAYSDATTGAAFAAVLALVLTTVFLYWCWPAWHVRGRRLVAFPEEKFPDLAADLRQLAARGGVTGTSFLLDLPDPGVSGRAFGRIGRRYVVLSRGLTARYAKDPDSARAVIAHEIAHLRNRDVDAGYATVWIWRVFLVVTVAPMAIWAAWCVATGAAGQVGTYGWRLAAAVALGLLVRSWLLRFRECLADARAHADGAAGLARLLSAQPADRRRLPGLRLHPSPRVRATVLADPSRLMKTPLWESAAIGAIAMLASEAVTMMAAVTGIHSPATVYVGMTATVVVVTWSVSQSALRDALAQRFRDPNFFAAGPSMSRRTEPEHIKGWPYHLAPGFRVGLGMSLGLVLGRVLALDPLAHGDLGHPSISPSALTPWAEAVGTVTFCIVCWTFLAARIWLPFICRRPNQHRAGLAALTSLSLITLPVLPRLLAKYLWYANLPWERAGISGRDAASTVFSQAGRTTSIWLLVALGALLIALLVLPYVGQRPHTPRDWVTLDPPAPSPWHRPASALRLAIVFSVFVVWAGYRELGAEPAPWLSADVPAMALTVTSQTNRTAVAAVGRGGIPVSCAEVIRMEGSDPPGSPVMSRVYSDMMNNCHGTGAVSLTVTGTGAYAELWPHHRQDLVFFSPDGSTWWRSYVLAVPGDRVTSAGAGAPIMVNGRAVPSVHPGEETTSKGALDVLVPAGDLWVTAVHWDTTSPPVYETGEPNGGLIRTSWTIAYQTW